MAVEVERPRNWRGAGAATFQRERGGTMELHKIYRVLADDDAGAEGDLRVVDESGEDYLYPTAWFATMELPRRVRTSLLRRPTRLESPRG
jgi:hypothetical protein